MILILTQPQQQAQRLAIALAYYDNLYQIDQIEQLPLTAIEPLSVSSVYIESLLLASDSIICTSPSVVPLLPQQLPQQALAAAWYAPGGGTAHRLEQRYGLVVTYPTEAWNSEALMELSHFQYPIGQRVLLVTGQGGRGYIEEVLVKRQALVDRLELYRRVATEVDSKHIEDRASEQYLWLVTSGETLSRLAALYSAKELRIMVTSQRLAKLASDSGYNHLSAASNKPDDIAQALQQLGSI